ncbi:MAG: hypothetical protein IT430_10435 [Phycisphaerales bacterium]|nr:hypothetical protein [Phycisphaerales bacterium]
MKFNLVDKVIEQTEQRIVTIKAVTIAEEYLQDHFPTYPVLPGVLMIEALVQAARQMLTPVSGNPRLVLGEVRALRYGSFVRPGEALKVEVSLVSQEDGRYNCKGVGYVLRPGEESPAGEPPTAVSGRFSLRPIRAAS